MRARGLCACLLLTSACASTAVAPIIHADQMRGFAADEARGVAHQEALELCTVRTGQLVVEVESAVVREWPTEPGSLEKKKQPLLLTDTVGFVRKLPHRLVEAFNATLEEATLSDFLIHLLDASQPEVVEFYNTTRKVLAELGADEKRTIVAFNKIDKVHDATALAALRRHFPEALFLSVQTGEGLDELVERMAEMVGHGLVTRELLIPQSAGGLLAQLHREARVLQTTYEGDAVRLVAVLPARLATACENFLEGGNGKTLIDPTFFRDKVIATG